MLVWWRGLKRLPEPGPRTSEDIRSRFVAAGIVQPLVSLLCDGNMDTRCKAGPSVTSGLLDTTHKKIQKLL